MPEQPSLKKTYQSPMVMGLGELARGSGICDNGSSPTIDEINCTAGPAASAACTAGGSALNQCTAGLSALLACSEGTATTTGACTAGIGLTTP